jgi:UDP-glucose 4-epimerase
VRDYIHVADLADAHLAAVNALHDTKGLTDFYNVGTGVGASVLEVIDTAREITGLYQPCEVTPRRSIDAASVVADPARIRRDLGWQAKYDLDAMISSAWSAFTREGFSTRARVNAREPVRVSA